MKFCFVAMIVFMSGCSGAGGTSLANIARECEIWGWSDEETEQAGIGMVVIAGTGVQRLVWEGSSREMCLDGSTCTFLFPEGPPPNCISACGKCIDTLSSYGCERAGVLCSDNGGVPSIPPCITACRDEFSAINDSCDGFLIAGDQRGWVDCIKENISSTCSFMLDCCEEVDPPACNFGLGIDCGAANRGCDR